MASVLPVPHTHKAKEVYTPNIHTSRLHSVFADREVDVLLMLTDSFPRGFVLK